MKKVLLLSFLLFQLSIFAQEASVTVTGTVADRQGIPIPGVNVIEKGTNNGVVTNFDGEFSITVDEESVLEFSYLGYATAEIEVNGRTQLEVVLEPQASSLDEVVVVGYGAQKKANLTGAVGAVSGEEITQQTVGQTKNALQGTIAGVTVTQNSGQPGSDGGTIRIRGLGTLGNNEPLVIVDGRESSLDNVAPHDIESISVLKDAASAAIYGARAANGVILVTTKRGGEGLSVGYDTWLAVQVPTDMPNSVDAPTHMEMLNEAYTNVGREPVWTEEQIEAHRNQMPSDQYPNTDWQEISTKPNAFMQNHNLTMSAGGEIAKVYASFNYMDQEGIVPNMDYQRYNFRVNSDFTITERLGASFDIALRQTNRKQPPGGSGYIFHWMRRIPATQAGILSNGRYGEGWNGNNPIARALSGGYDTDENLGATLNFQLDYKLTDWLSATVAFSPRVDNPHSETFNNVVTTYQNDGVTPAFNVPVINSLTENFSRTRNNNFQALLNGEKDLGSHNIGFTAGYQQQEEIYHYVLARRENFQFPDYQEINSAPRANELTGGNTTHWALRSYFGRVQYNYDERYLFEGNVRFDESSRFAEGNRRGVFPSFSAGWRISEENFMENIDFIDQLKLRASWGQLGNQEIGLYPYLTQVNLGQDYIFDNQRAVGAALTTMANPDISWETSESTNFGLDAVLWEKLDITFDYYRRLTRDILLRLEIPRTLGLTAPYVNAGVVENRGWELNVGFRDYIGDLDYGINFNLSDVKNEILDLNGIEGSGLVVNHEGHPIGSFYGYVADGFFQSEEEVANHATQIGDVAPGDIRYIDLNDDGVITADDQTIIGSPLPRYSVGARIDADYKAFDFSLFLQGVGKADGYLYGQGIMPFYVGGTVQEQHMDHWTPDNRDAAYPRLAFNSTNNELNSTFWMRDASYLRLKNVQIGYTLPEGFVGGLESVRVYYSGRNLFTIDNFYEGYDPEAPVSSGGWYPQMKVHTAGLTINF